MYLSKSISKWWTTTIVVFTSIYHIYISQSVSSTFPGNRFSQDWSKKLLRRRFVIWSSRHKTWRWQMETKQVKQWHATLWRMYLGKIIVDGLNMVTVYNDIDVRSKSMYFIYTLIYCTGSLYVACDSVSWSKTRMDCTKLSIIIVWFSWRLTHILLDWSCTACCASSLMKEKWLLGYNIMNHNLPCH